ncbi:hypothetical protein I4I78_00205 [Pseudonocardia sp. KRD-291]|nr:hypothetical protein [Pseudonocardia sp. KRD291]
MAGELPEILADRLGGQWTVQVGDTKISLDAQGALPMVQIGAHARDQGGWDATVLLSDLPRRAGSQPVVADASTRERVGLVSLPALGALAQYRRTRDTVIRLVTHHLLPDSEPRQSTDDGGAAGPLTQIDPEHTQGSAEGDVTNDAAQEADTDEAGAAGTEDAVDVRLGLAGMRGRARLLAGMVRANRPWRLVSSLSPALAAAAAGAAFGIFYSNIWTLAAALGIGRHVAVALLAVVAMIVWLIANNQLWERRSSRSLREEAILSNTSTVLTVGAGVVIMYAVLFVIALIASAIVIPADYLASQLSRAPGFDDYVVIAWLSCSMGTVAGALGSGFADEDAVRQAAYSRREQERRARLDQHDDDQRERE